MSVAFRNGSPHAKLHVLQESTNNTANTNKQEKMVIVRKKQKIAQDPPKAISVTSIINNLQTKTKKQQKVKDAISTRVQNPPPIAVARRNARERNRVKQVNNGFATLRQHIPDEIAEIYENANNSRAANKKLSKVETLRMAVEYIRSLEDILSIDGCGNNSNLSLSSFPSPASSESLQNGSSFEQGYFSLQSPLLEDEDSNPPTPLPPVSTHHYSRIPGTNTFQLLPGPPPLTYEDEENVHPLTPNSDLISQEDIMISNNILNTDYIQSAPEFTVIHPNMLSPHIYSESSSSPQNIDMLDVKYSGLMPGHQILYQSPVVYNQSIMVPNDIPLERFSKILRHPNDALITDSHLMVDGKIVFEEMKREPEEMDGSFQKDGDTDDSMDDVIKWWETEGRHEDQS